MLQRYSKLRLAILLYQANNAGGAWRSISAYHAHAMMEGDSVKLINRSGRRTFRQAAAATVAAPRLLFNGMDSFYRWEAIIICLLRPSSLIYLHETGYMLDQYQRNCPFRYRLVKRILGRNPILAVSEKAAALYRERFGSQRVEIVYECLPKPGDRPESNGRTQVCMVGTIDPRKGATLYSRTADLATEKGLPWDFHWIGGQGSQEEMYLSERVHWRGWHDHPTNFVRHCDVFFLASIDDPFPIACLEALRDYRRCVAYSGTGISEVLDDLNGCSIFSEYDPDSALTAIERALAEEPNNGVIDSLFEEKLSVSAFRNRLSKILS